jgi:hypothetical protein
MNIRLVGIFVMCFAASIAVGKDKNSFPKQIVAAKYVMVTSYFGDNVADARIPPMDRQAVIDVQDAVREWGRYTLVYERKAADLILLVRKGRIVNTTNGVGIQAGSNMPTAIGPIYGADAGDPDDMIAIYNASLGTDTAPIWRERMSDGLDKPEMKLIRELRKKVEGASKKP